MGTYRLILAALVAISHTGNYFNNYNPGVVAVISFFLLSGFVMRSLIERHYLKLSSVPAFYADRAGRLLPQFLFYIAASFIVIYTLDIEHYVLRMTPWLWFLNSTMLPLGFYMFWERQPPIMIMAQAWSLGLEACFYLVIPFILIYCKPRVRYWLAWCSFAVFFAAHIGIIDGDVWGYRLLPGTLFMFLVGASYHDQDSATHWFRWSIFGIVSLMWLHAYTQGIFYDIWNNKEVMAGLLAGMIMMEILRRFRFSDFDEFAGNLSYGLFLNHFIVIWLMQKYMNVQEFYAADVTFLLLACGLLAWISYYLIERPALIWRRKFRKSGNSTTSRPAAHPAIPYK